MGVVIRGGTIVTADRSWKSDVYAASVCLWEALTARRLFQGENDASVLNQVLHAELTPPSVHVSGLDPAWDEIVARGLERDPERRYETAREMALAIEGRFAPARATEVGAWVESLARETLVKRAAEVAGVESTGDVDLTPSDAVHAPAPPAEEPAPGAFRFTGTLENRRTYAKGADAEALEVASACALEAVR